MNVATYVFSPTAPTAPVVGLIWVNTGAGTALQQQVDGLLAQMAEVRSDAQRIAALLIEEV